MALITQNDLMRMQQTVRVACYHVYNVSQHDRWFYNSSRNHVDSVGRVEFNTISRKIKIHIHL